LNRRKSRGLWGEKKDGLQGGYEPGGREESPEKNADYLARTAGGGLSIGVAQDGGEERLNHDKKGYAKAAQEERGERRHGVLNL